MNGRAPAIHDHLASLADTTRSRVLLLLDRHELTVSEICTILQLPQSTVSRHLKALGDSGWVGSRAEGTSRFYTMTRDELDAGARRLWLLVRDQVGSSPAAARLSSTCCRTIVSTTGSRWATSGSGSARITRAACSRRRHSTTFGLFRYRPMQRQRARVCSSRQARGLADNEERSRWQQS